MTGSKEFREEIIVWDAFKSKEKLSWHWNQVEKNDGINNVNLA